MNCYRNGGCGPYENRSCSECPASKPEYTALKDYPPYLDYPRKQKPMTNADRIRAMTDEELAEQIYKGISSDPCDYCKHNNLHCDGSPCQGKADVETIIEWLQQLCGGADHE